MAGIGRKRPPSAGTEEAGGTVGAGGMTVTATAGVITMPDGKNRFVFE